MKMKMKMKNKKLLKTNVYLPAVAPPLANASSGATAVVAVAITPIKPSVEAVDEVKNSLRDDGGDCNADSLSLTPSPACTILRAKVLLLPWGVVKAWPDASSSESNAIETVFIVCNKIYTVPGTSLLHRLSLSPSSPSSPSSFLTQQPRQQQQIFLIFFDQSLSDIIGSF